MLRYWEEVSPANLSLLVNSTSKLNKLVSEKLVSSPNFASNIWPNYFTFIPLEMIEKLKFTYIRTKFDKEALNWHYLEFDLFSSIEYSLLYCCLAAPRLTLGHYRGGSLIHPMRFYIFDPTDTGSLVTRLGP